MLTLCWIHQEKKKKVMREVSLQCCLSKYSLSPGKEADHIGLGMGSGLRYGKYLLSHDAKKGWDIVKLNRIQLMLRNIFGFYAATRAATISKGWHGMAWLLWNKMRFFGAISR